MPDSTGELKNFPDKLEIWVAELKELQAVSEAHVNRLEEAITEARQGKLGQPPPPLVAILLLGASGAGKSELLNALAGERIAESNYLRPTTTQPTVYAHKDLGIDRLYEFGPALGDLAKEPGGLRAHTREELRHKIIIDAPDIDSFKTEHRSLVLRLMPVVDVALYVVTAHNYKDDIGWQTMIEQRAHRAFAFVFNKWDAEGKPRAQPGVRDVDEDFIAMLQSRAGFDRPLLFRTSAKHWVEARADGKEGPPPTGDEFLKLEEWLGSGLSTNQVEQIKRRRARSLWAAVGSRIRAGIPPELDTERWLAGITAELKEIEADGATLLKPALMARAITVAQKRQQERQPTSPGPFGLAMRAITSLGSGVRYVKRLSGNNGDEAMITQTTRLPERVGEMLARRIDALEWETREAKIPSGWIATRWQQATSDTFPRLTETTDIATAQLETFRTGRLRRGIAITLLGILELLTIAIIGVSAWRLTLAFLSGDYLQGAFVANLAALLLCMFLLGTFLLNLLAPRLERLFARELETKVIGTWRESLAKVREIAEEFARRYEEVRTNGTALAESCAEQIEALTRQIGRMPKQDVAEAEQLFSTVETTSP